MQKLRKKPKYAALLASLGLLLIACWSISVGCDDHCGVLATAETTCRQELDCSVPNDPSTKRECEKQKYSVFSHATCSNDVMAVKAEACLRIGLRRPRLDDTPELAKVYCTCLPPNEPPPPDGSPAERVVEGEYTSGDRPPEPSLPEKESDTPQESTATETMSETTPETAPEASIENNSETTQEGSAETEGTDPSRIDEVLIPAGMFTMGSPVTEVGRKTNEAQYQATLTRSFFMSKHEITQRTFLVLMGYNPSHFSACGKACPVDSVNWHEAAAFCNAASRMKGLPECFSCSGTQASVRCSAASAYAREKYYTCLGYRLPTEAEWEYAYRAGTTTALYNGDLVSQSCSPPDPKADAVGWFNCNSKSTTHPVGEKQPNAWGLYDMAGNVLEWVFDFSAPYPTQATTDPIALSGEGYVTRGGAYNMVERSLRAAARYGMSPTTRMNSLGFRVVRTSP